MTKQPCCCWHGETPPSPGAVESCAHGVSVPRQLAAPPLFHEQPVSPWHAVWFTKELQGAMVPVQLVVVQLQLYSLVHVADEVFALHGVTVPVQAALDQLQTSFASHVVCDAKVEHAWAVPLQLVPLQLHPAAMQ
jgi:hypothetical protein